MATAVLAAHPGQIWRDDCYYLDRKTGEYQRKYLLVPGGLPPRSTGQRLGNSSRSLDQVFYETLGHTEVPLVLREISGIVALGQNSPDLCTEAQRVG